MFKFAWGTSVFAVVAGMAAHRFDSTPIDVEFKPGQGERVWQPAPPVLSDAECREQRHRIFAEAMDIRDHELRLKQLRTAPVCK